MNTLFKRVGVAALFGLSANSALATWVEGYVYCDINGSGQLELTQDAPLPDVEVTVQCIGASQDGGGEGPNPVTCPEPNLPFTQITGEGGEYLIHLVKETDLTYLITVDGAPLPPFPSFILPSSQPVIFSYPLSPDDEFANPWLTHPYVAKVDWLVSGDICQDTGEPAIEIVKEVSLNGGEFMDADTVATAPGGGLGSSAEYRLTVTNTGTEALFDVEVTDAALGLTDVALSVNPLEPGESVVLDSGSTGFALLSDPDACSSRGAHLNTASVIGTGLGTGTSVSSEESAYVVCEEPQIELRKQVSLDGINYFDADMADATDVPVGIVGEANAYYRLVVTNIGSETLTNVTIEDATIGINATIADLAPGVSQVIESGETGFGNLYQEDICQGTPGNKSNVASVNAAGIISNETVSDANPANVRCIVGPAIEIVKQVKFDDGSEFVDANTAETGPTAQLNADLASRSAVYRLVVRNIGDEDLTSVAITDVPLNIIGEFIADLPVGAEVVIAESDAGFGALYAEGQCSAEGTIMNVAEVNASGALTNKHVSSEDPAYVNCEMPLECSVTVDQTCQVVQQASDDKLCTSSISATTLRYTGPSVSDATVTFTGKDGGDVEYTNVDLVSGVTILTKPSENNYTLDAGIGEKLGSKTTIVINGVEEIIHTSCSAIYVAGEPAPLDGDTPNPANSDKGEPSPNWEVVSFRQKDDIVIAEETALSESADACTLPYGGGEVAYAYFVENTGAIPVVVTSVLDSELGEMLASDSTLAAGESMTITSNPVLVNANTISEVSVSANAATDSGVICPAEDTVSVELEPAPQLSCEDGKPAVLGITYIGGSCADSDNDQGSKASCSGDSSGASPVTLTIEDKKGNLYLSEVVNINDAVILDAAMLGKSKLDSETNVYIENASGVLQHINFHTSCSAPLEVGDRHGGIVITSFVPEEGGKGGGKGKGKGKDKGKDKGKSKSKGKDKGKSKSKSKSKSKDKGKKGKDKGKKK